MFIVSKIFWILFRPGSVLLALLSVGAFMAWRGRVRGGLRLVTAAIIALAAIAYLPVASWLIAPLENRFADSPEATDDPEGVILLGGWQDQRITAYRGSPEVNEAADRIFLFVELARRHPNARLVVSGGGGLLRGDSVTECDVARMVLAQIGFDDSRVIYENKSRNTWENVVFSRRAAQPSAAGTWLLVTSASHMPRSMGIFRRLGWTVLPRQTDYRSVGSGLSLQALQDLGERLHILDVALREWVGLVAYRLMDRTDALFPSPTDAPGRAPDRASVGVLTAPCSTP